MSTYNYEDIKRSLECCIVHGKCDNCIFRDMHPFACLTELHKQLLILLDNYGDNL